MYPTVFAHMIVHSWQCAEMHMHTPFWACPVAWELIGILQCSTHSSIDWRAVVSCIFKQSATAWFCPVKPYVTNPHSTLHSKALRLLCTTKKCHTSHFLISNFEENHNPRWMVLPVNIHKFINLYCPHCEQLALVWKVTYVLHAITPSVVLLCPQRAAEPQQ